MNITDTCIAANIDQLEARLFRASNIVHTALRALHDGKRNLAIGTLLPLEQILPEGQALLSTVLLLHRTHNNIAIEGTSHD